MVLCIDEIVPSNVVIHLNFQKIEIIFKILTMWAAGSATARQSFGLEYFGQASFNLLRQGRLSLDTTY